MICPSCGKEIENGSNKCPFCHINISNNQTLDVDAGTNAGEVLISSDGSLINKPVQRFSQVIKDGFMRIINSFKNVFKNKRVMITTIVMIVVWLILDIINGSGNDSIVIKILSFMTFANAGMNGGIFGFIGGVIGKGVFTGAVVSIVNSIGKKNNGFFRDFKEIFNVGKGNVFPYIFGIGIAFFGFLLISGGMTRLSFMGGIGAAYVFTKASARQGFAQNFFASIFAKGQNKIPSFVPSIIKGISIGFMGASLIGLTGINLILYLFGFIAFNLGLVMTIISAVKLFKAKGGNK